MASSPAPARRLLPPAVSRRMLADADRIARRMSLRIASEIPLGGDFATVGYLRLVVRACRDGVRSLVRHLHDGSPPPPAELEYLGEAGARQADMEVPIELMLAAYRLAAKVVWREVVDEATRLGELEPATVVALTEQVLQYLDTISGSVGRAYLARREEVVRRRDLDRDRVLRRLLAGDASADVRRLAVAAGIVLAPPYRALAVGAGPGAADGERLLTRAWEKARPLVVAEEPGTWIALVPADVPVEDLVTRALGAAAAAGWQAADRRPPLVIGAGPVAETLEAVAGAAGRARRTLSAGRLLDPDVALHDDRETGVLAGLADQPEAAEAYVDRLLGPLLANPARHRELLATLEALLASRGLGETADRLHVHRHTVVYRLGRLSELLGLDLDDPRTRHRLWLALTLRRLRG